MEPNDDLAKLEAAWTHKVDTRKWGKISFAERIRPEPVDDHVEAPKDYGNW